MNVVRTEQYGGTAALVLENEVLRVVVLPDRGSKMASLFYKPENIELLWQPPDGRHPAAQYGDEYTAEHATGFDEMFPSIAPCRYEAFPWSGIEIPDHGEVWSLPWAWAKRDADVHLHIQGVRFPYRLTKRVRLLDNGVEIAYEAANMSDFDFDFLWAAHPLFNAWPDMEIVVPQGMNAIVNTAPTARMPDYGRVYRFPVDQLADGRPFAFNRMPPRNTSAYQKYYFQGAVTEGWCELRHPRAQLAVRLEFPIQEVPYLGMWVNEGGWHGHYNIATEPATGAMDRIDAAKLWGWNSVLQARQTKTWWLRIAVGVN